MAFSRIAGGLHGVLPDVTGADHHQDLPALIMNAGEILRGSSAGVMTAVGQASQAQMEAGVDSSTRALSALRVAQAIAAQAPPTQMIRSGNVTANAVSVTWGTAFVSAPSVLTSYFTTSTASRHSHTKTSSTTGATCFGNENAEPLDVFAKLATP